MPMMQGPRWLQVLLEEKFFEECSVHEVDSKNEKNILCLECSVAVCAHCLTPDHTSHRVIQIRRYVYHDVIRLEDADKLMNCSSIQSYVNNGAKVVFLKERAQARPFRASGNVCLSCRRCLQHPFSFCSLCCKVKHLLQTEDGSSSLSLLSASASDRSGAASAAAALLDQFHIVRKRRTSLTAPHQPPLLLLDTSPSPSSSINRRKTCTPHRSPLY